MSIRCAVIGYGMGRLHAQYINGCEGLELVAVCDVDGAKRAVAATDRLCPSTTLLGEFHGAVPLVGDEIGFGEGLERRRHAREGYAEHLRDLLDAHVAPALAEAEDRL